MFDLPQKGQFLLYQTEDGRFKIDVRFEGETVWLTQKRMTELFQKDVRTISEHIKAIFDEGELLPESVLQKFRITARDGKIMKRSTTAWSHYFRWLPGTLTTWHTVSYLGHAAASGIHRQRLCAGRRATEKPRSAL